MENDISYFTYLSTDNLYQRQEKYDRVSGLAGTKPFDYPFDTEYDIYQINFKNLSASFFVRKNGVVEFITYFPYKVEISSGKIVVTDDKGIKYNFGTIVYQNQNYGAVTNFEGTDGPMVWYIASIETPRNGFLRFVYEAINTANNSNLDGNYSHLTVASLGDHAYGYPNNDPYAAYSRFSSRLGLRFSYSLANNKRPIMLLKKIESNNESVDFVYNVNKYSLNSIFLVGTDPLKNSSITFDYQNVLGVSFTVPNNQGIAVSGINYKGLQGAGNPGHGYTFEYYQGSCHGASLVEYSYGKDYWGYANNNSNSNLIPIDNVNEYKYPYNNVSQTAIGAVSRRLPNFTQKQIGVLKKVIYPTKGYTEFTYEENLYDHFGQTKSGPGIRIKKIRNFDGKFSTIKEYKYGPNENGKGELAWKPQVYDFQNSVLVSEFGTGGKVIDINNNGYINNGLRYRQREFFSEPRGHIQPAYRRPVYYSQVTEYLKDSLNNDLGKTVYEFSFGSNVIVSNYFTDGRTNEAHYHDLLIENLFYRALPSYVGYYKNVNGNYSLVRSITHQYEILKPKSFPQATFYKRHSILPDATGSSFDNEKFVETYKSGSQMDPDWDLPWTTVLPIAYNLVTGAVKPVSIIENEFFDNVSFERKTELSYGSSYVVEPSQKKIVSSNGTSLIQKFYFPDDITSASLSGGALSSQELAGIQKMNKSNNHIVSLPIQVETAVGTSLTELVRNTYTVVDLKPLPHKIYSSKNLSLRTSFHFISHDSYGNPREVRSLGMPVTVYLWGYGGHYPIAKIENSTYAEVTGALGSNATTILNSLNSSTVSDATIDTHMTTLRNSLKSARVTSYTYSPLVGMTSMTDPRGNKESYQYDGFRRLKNVLDFSNNILKNYQYNYRTN